jgi:hypothetical protein
MDCRALTGPGGSGGRALVDTMIRHVWPGQSDLGRPQGAELMLMKLRKSASALLDSSSRSCLCRAHGLVWSQTARAIRNHSVPDTLR